MASLRTSKPPRHPRRGMSTLLVVAALVFVMSSIAVMLRQSTLSRKQMRIREYRLQATLLAESAMERAVLRAGADTAYASESWEITPTDLGTRYAGLVKITVDRDKMPAEIHVSAIYPKASPMQAQVKKQRKVDL